MMLQQSASSPQMLSLMRGGEPIFIKKQGIDENGVPFFETQFFQKQSAIPRIFNSQDVEKQIRQQSRERQQQQTDSTQFNQDMLPGDMSNILGRAVKILFIF